jgi:SanA protein
MEIANIGKMKRKKQGNIFKSMIIFAIVAGAILTLLLILRLGVWLAYRSQMYPVADVPKEKVALVFGAGLTRSGNPTPILVDRITAAAQLYFAGKVEKILLSGDNSYVNYNEPSAMQKYALSLGVPKNVLVLDYAGRRTYDTCYRAKYIFQVNEAILVTQNFHLPRALLTCTALGIKATGISADLRKYHLSSLIPWQIRETLANFVAILDVTVFHPKPILGPVETLFP